LACPDAGPKHRRRNDIARSNRATGDFRMTFATRAVVALLATAAAAPAFAQYGGSYDPKPDPREAPRPAAPTAGQVAPSKKAYKAIIELQAAVTANDAAAIAEKTAAAQAVATTKEDRYLIGQLQLKAAVARKDYPAAGTALAAVRASGYLPADKVGALYRGLGVEAYKAKQYDQAASLLEAAMAVEPNSQEAVILLAEARIAQGRKAEGLALLQRAIQARVAAGQKPEESLYKRAVQAAYEARLPAASDLARDWLVAYPSKESWRNSIAIYRNLNQPDLESTLALLRLMRAAGALTVASDFTLYANALSEQSNFIEAQTALDQAIAAKQVDASNPQIQSIVAALKSKPRPTAADLTAAAKSAETGVSMLRIGDRFYGLGEYAKAVELYRQAMGKPGVDNNIANLHIGMALAASGDKAGATQAFNAVTGPRAGAAKYWLMFLQSRGYAQEASSPTKGAGARRRLFRVRPAPLERPACSRSRLSRFGMVKWCRLSAPPPAAYSRCPVRLRKRDIRCDSTIAC
jgi:hypothetical protein